MVFSIPLYFWKFFVESSVESKSALSAIVLWFNMSLVRFSRVTGAELRPAAMAAMDEKLFKFLNS